MELGRSRPGAPWDGWTGRARPRTRYGRRWAKDLGNGSPAARGSRTGVRGPAALTAEATLPPGRRPGIGTGERPAQAGAERHSTPPGAKSSSTSAPNSLAKARSIRRERKPRRAGGRTAARRARARRFPARARRGPPGPPPTGSRPGRPGREAPRLGPPPVRARRSTGQPPPVRRGSHWGLAVPWTAIPVRGGAEYAPDGAPPGRHRVPVVGALKFFSGGAKVDSIDRRMPPHSTRRVWRRMPRWRPQRIAAARAVKRSGPSWVRGRARTI
jgi:hypothetical protein